MSKRSESEDLKAQRAWRISVSLQDSGVKQIAVARHCGIKTQSITNWRKTGQVSDWNLFRLSELTGFRYIWLKHGTGDRRYSDAQLNRKDYFGQTAMPSFTQDIEAPPNTSEGERLLASVRRVCAKKAGNTDALVYLADLLDCLAGFKPPAKDHLSENHAARMQKDLKLCLTAVSEHTKQIKPELRPAIGELLKSLCEKPDSSEVIIQSILATAAISSA